MRKLMTHSSKRLLKSSIYISFKGFRETFLVPINISKERLTTKGISLRLNLSKSMSIIQFSTLPGIKKFFFMYSSINVQARIPS